ncbi:hypothetical protein FH972_023114 [Carpinus fangiana]|uniref:Uncharacterized protein n=1 Tax=Carpinus fangiana TaxID=176857 RepID=A0A5N6KUH9_9ROSI|nr:hypothetical protein FH972_023114 [Carpinus fangiana]
MPWAHRIMVPLSPFLALLCTCVCVTSATAKSLDASYGLAFSLSMDYGVASAYFPNGTYRDIAKIEGGPRFKDYMRHIDPVGAPDSVVSEHLQAEDSFLGGVLKHLWPIRHPSNNPLTAMFKALRSASESALERPVSIVEIAVNCFPHGPRLSTFFAEIDAALEDSSMEKLRPPRTNGEMAARAKGIEGYCGDEPGDPCDPERVVLSVENTRSGLTIIMWTETSGSYDFHRVLHSPELGQDSLDNCERRNANQSCIDELKNSIRTVAKMPLKFNWGGLERIEAIVLLGEGAVDARLNGILRDILQEQYATEVIDVMLSSASTDPIFLASRNLARTDWTMKDNGNKAADIQDRWELR